MVVLELLLSGLIIQVLSGGNQFVGLHWPVNLIAGLTLVILLIIIRLFFRRVPFVKWLSSIPAAVSSISFFAVVVLLLGFIPQQNPDAPGIIKILGLNSIRNGWLLLVSGLYLITCLGLVILRRFLPLNLRNIGFMLNHAGLWIILFAGSLGTGDLKRLTIQLTEGQEYRNSGIDQAGNEVPLPFSFRLLDFTIDEYPPKIGIGNSRTGEIVNNSGTTLYQIREDQEYVIGDREIMVKKIITDAYPGHEGFHSVDSAGAAPAAFVSATNLTTNNKTEGWISCGSNAFSAAFLSLDSDFVLFMNQPEPEKYSSLIEIKQDGKTETVTIEVNKPVHIRGYSMYQLSYDESLGKWSTVSVIEAVKDPWIPLIYAGIIMMLAGSVYLFWKGNEIRKE